MHAQAGSRFIVSITCGSNRETSHYANYKEVQADMDRMEARYNEEAFWECATPEKLLATRICPHCDTITPHSGDCPAYNYRNK